ncbi:NAD(P)-dependent glycerol-1-phosphate dehydrogenase [Methanobrevibacter sp.]|uniref:NAD(P)-dependent glycerol-1-phosphate dehydrogenase n=1 Tax=Methanobrevibacter sp. TaxID=66852 RepID=UPI0026DF7311|nr:NAD(P)-dependent glycerol-1-phosphate dehydrogenase [Methanobrevibacter sp.]MDO5823406.1 NAD(P)-dependent glycerol-1-phosphate dehydrogenase [Methanobrevibacter sp.]
MTNRKIQMPREVYIDPGIIKDTAEICKSLHLNKKFLIVTGSTTYDIGAKLVIESLEKDNLDYDVIKVDGASDESIFEVEELITPETTVLGVGGGKVIDIAKLSSFNKGVYFVSMPTTASHDGIVSPMASIKNPNTSISVTAHSPIAVIADSEVIAQSPFRLLSAGCADLISNFTAIKDWELAHRLKNEPFSESAAALSIMSAHLITDNIDNIKPNLEPSARIVMKSLFSGGMAISIAGSSRPASGSEHLFSHALDKILDKSALHGEQCGIGTIMMMYLHGGNWSAIKDALSALKAPTTAAEVGICDDDIIDALVMAHKIRPDRYTILGDKGISREAAYELAYKTGVI